MGRTIRPAVLANLDADKLELLNELSKRTRIARAVLIREAVEDLLVKHKMLRAPKRPK